MKPYQWNCGSVRLSDFKVGDMFCNRKTLRRFDPTTYDRVKSIFERDHPDEEVPEVFLWRVR